MEIHDYIDAMFSTTFIHQITKPIRITVITYLVNTINLKESFSQIFLIIYQYLY